MHAINKLLCIHVQVILCAKLITPVGIHQLLLHLEKRCSYMFSMPASWVHEILNNHATKN